MKTPLINAGEYFTLRELQTKQAFSLSKELLTQAKNLKRKYPETVTIKGNFVTVEETGIKAITIFERCGND